MFRRRCRPSLLLRKMLTPPLRNNPSNLELENAELFLFVSVLGGVHISYTKYWILLWHIHIRASHALRSEPFCLLQGQPGAKVTTRPLPTITVLLNIVIGAAGARMFDSGTKAVLSRVSMSFIISVFLLPTPLVFQFSHHYSPEYFGCICQFGVSFS